MASVKPKLFQSYQLGEIPLQHRVALCPLTRYKASRITHVPQNPLMKTHYAQRGSTPGTLLITEATFIAAKAGGDPYVPGIWSKEQINVWKEITDGVHKQGSYIICQLWALGRAAKIAALTEEGLSYVAPSAIALSTRPSDIPRELSIEEIQEYVQLFSQAAKNAIEAGFDGVEIHNANGYLSDQFVHEASNQRTDIYGGSIENRNRFTLEIAQAVTDAIGSERTGIRISPWGLFQDMKIEDPEPQYSHLVATLKERFPNFGYLHVVEPRVNGPTYADKSNDFLREIWAPKPFISAGGYTRETAIAAAEEKGDLIAFGRPFIANPDLPIRLEKNISLNEPDFKTFFVPGDKPDTDHGYTDYPFADELGKEKL